MVKHTLRILQHLLQDFERELDHFVDTRHYRVKFFLGHYFHDHHYVVAL